ncbi:hypothetical protein B9Z19DRAFT_1119434 [Tuber borchii]|uniref:Uncharacterized protein n=1 Tax=Tuber borchii TaxID=42251 RepID=A0A2T7A6J8_TUBBO|nr:hypothetical protein B9Z19DRAFT_1119434 [Tuber borchii]
MERDPFALRIECLMMVETGHRQTRRIPGRFPRCLQDFEIDETGAVVSTMGSTELEIPYDTIFDNYHPESLLLPPPPARFCFLELSRFAVRMFQDLKNLIAIKYMREGVVFAYEVIQGSLHALYIIYTSFAALVSVDLL